MKPRKPLFGPSPGMGSGDGGQDLRNSTRCHLELIQPTESRKMTPATCSSVWLEEFDASTTGRPKRVGCPASCNPSQSERCSMTETVVSGSPRTMRVLSMYIREKWKYLDKQTVYRTTRSRHSMKIERITSGLRQRTAWIDFGTRPLLP